MNTKELYQGSVVTLRGRSGALTTGITNLQELYNQINYNLLSNTFLIHAVDCVSASVADTSAGTGAQQIEISGLDGDYKFQTEVVTLNGQTAVTSTKKWLRVFSAQVTRAGSGGVNAGNIVVYKSGQGGVVAGGIPPTLTSAWLRIIAGFGMGTSGLFTVPVGTKVEARNITMTARTQVSELHIVSQTPGTFEVLELTITAVPTVNGNLTITLDGVAGPLVAVATTDDTIKKVVDKIAATKFLGWSTTTTDTKVVFTSNVGIARTGANTLGVASTGVTGAFVETVAGTTNPFFTEFTMGTTNTAINIPLPMQNGFSWTEKTDIYLRALSTTAAGVVTANLLMRSTPVNS